MSHFEKPLETAHDDIAVTAINTAWLMSYTDIEHFPEIANTARAIWQEGDHAVQPALLEPTINAPGIEVRYRQATNQLKGASQVIDIAAGLTPRGFNATSQNPDLTYVEIDLPIMRSLKSAVLQRLVNSEGLSMPTNLHLLGGNALHREDLMCAQQYMETDEPLHITSEGLLHYFTHAEKAQMARNILHVMHEHPESRWYTDMPVQRGVTSRDSIMAQATSQQSKRNVAGNRFSTAQDAEQFFAACGLTLTERHSYTEPELLASLTSPGALGVDIAEVAMANEPWSLWEFQLATSGLKRTILA